jgi:hypothetical protein
MDIMQMSIADVITSISVAIAAISFVFGVSAWKREFVGKRRIELAESVLALFYEAEDAIREIRNPASHGGEGKTRKRVDGEREEESALLDQAYVVFERYEKREKLFAQLRAMKYRVMASFGSDAGEPFDEINTVLNKIFVAAHALGSHYWPRQGRVSMSQAEFERHIEAMHEKEAIFWFMGDEDDQIGPRVRKAVEGIEEITRKAIASQSGWLNSLKNWIGNCGRPAKK